MYPISVGTIIAAFMQHLRSSVCGGVLVDPADLTHSSIYNARRYIGSTMYLKSSDHLPPPLALLHLWPHHPPDRSHSTCGIFGLVKQDYADNADVILLGRSNTSFDLFAVLPKIHAIDIM